MYKRQYQNFWQGRTDVDEAQEHITFLIGFYADGFFDRRPIKMGSADGRYHYCVSSGNAQAAYLGILVYNEANNASVFFPSAGRRQNKAVSYTHLCSVCWRILKLLLIRIWLFQKH